MIFNIQSYLIPLLLITFQLDSVSIKVLKQNFGLQDIFTGTQAFLKQIEKEEQSTQDKYLSVLMKLILQKLAHEKERSAIFNRLKVKASRGKINKAPASYVFTGFILQQALFLKELPSDYILGYFNYLNTLIQQSRIYLKYGLVFLKVSTMNKEYLNLFRFLLTQKISFHLDEINNLVALASKEGCSEILDLCITCNLALDCSSRHSMMTPLMHAAYRGHMDIIDMLLKNGVDINKKDNLERTALVYAIEWGQTEAVEFLLSEDAEIDAQALILACFQGYDDITNLLINECTDVNMVGFGGNTALMILAKEGNKKMVKRIIRKGADINAQNCLGKTALSNARECKHELVIELLLRNGAVESGEALI